MNSPIRVVASDVYQGLNVYAPVPVIRLTVDLGVVRDWTIGKLGPRFVESILDRVPGVAKPEATDLPELAAAVAVELQNLAGANLNVTSTASAGSDGVFHVVYEYENRRVGRQAGRLAIDLLNDLLQAGLRPPGAWVSGFDYGSRLKALLAFGRVAHMSVQDAAVVGAARARGIEVTKVRKRIIQLGQGRAQKRMSGSKTTLTNVIATSLTSNKDDTSRLLGELGLPVAVQKLTRSAGAAVAAAEEIGYPVVIKPIRGNLGRGVTVHLTDASQVESAFERARSIRPTVLVEKFIPGTDYRMLVINGQLIAASMRVPAHVVGDGILPIDGLIGQANLDPRRGQGHRGMWTALELDERALRLLTQQGYGPDSIPPLGKVVYLRDIANTSAGGTAVDVTDDVHSDNKAMAVRAANVTGLDVVGVDFITTDISRSYKEVGGAICEINSKPGLRKHMWPALGKPRDVVGPILDMLFPPGTPVTIPIAVIAGGNRSTSLLLTRLLMKAGMTTGLATNSGVQINQDSIVTASMTPPAGARFLLIDPTVDAALIEASAEEILSHGLGLTNYQVGAVLSDGGHSASAHGLSKSPVDALRLVLNGAQQLAVVNADDAANLLPEGISPDRTCLVTTKELGFVRSHIRANGRAVVASGDATSATIGLYENGDQIAQLSIPSTGAPVRSDAAFAVAIAYGLGMSPERIRAGLSVS